MCEREFGLVEKHHSESGKRNIEQPDPNGAASTSVSENTTFATPPARARSRGQHPVFVMTNRTAVSPEGARLFTTTGTIGP